MDYSLDLEMEREEICEKQAKALVKKDEIKKSFMKKGISIALFSGAAYGLYTTFLTLGMSKGIWEDWYGINSAGLSSFVVVYLLAALGNAINDICSSFWAIGNAVVQGKFKDFLRCINTKPGRILITAALVGGPIAGTCYVIALQMAGSIIVPIAALCPAIAAILGKVLYKQEINKRMAVGISICIMASFIIGSTGLSGDVSSNLMLGITIAFIAAVGWGFEGCVAGYASAMIEPQIGICIRQLASGIVNLFIVVPILGFIAGDIGISTRLVLAAVTDPVSMVWFVISGLFTFFAFMAWYAGNSMCGAGLGAACNGTFSFFGPFFCYIVLGVVSNMDGWNLPPIVWIGAVIMMIGILTIATNPLDILKNMFKGEK